MIRLLMFSSNGELLRSCNSNVFMILPSALRSVEPGMSVVVTWISITIWQYKYQTIHSLCNRELMRAEWVANRSRRPKEELYFFHCIGNRYNMRCRRLMKIDHSHVLITFYNISESEEFGQMRSKEKISKL